MAAQKPSQEEVFPTRSASYLALLGASKCPVGLNALTETNPIAALTDMRRVLRPGGRLFFVEHGLPPEIRTARWQHRLTPYWKRISGGCHLDRKTDDLIRAAGFQIDAIEMAYMQGPKPWTFMYQGSAKNVRAAFSG